MDKPNPASFRDPDGFLFTRDQTLYRQVNVSYKGDYDLLMGSGLYKELAGQGLMVEHRELDIPFAQKDCGFKIIEPEPLDFISYPYEWSFSQLKDAALATLAIQKKAFEFGMSLKDASAYNIQFRGGKPVFIDTLSFEKYPEGKPWVAYRQFCQHFLAPLAVIALTDTRLSRLLRTYIDGLPLDLAVKLLPFSARFRFSLYIHLFLHAKSQLKHRDTAAPPPRRNVSKLGFMGIIDSLESAVKKLAWKAGNTEWGNYYDDTNYTPEGLEHKKKVISQYIEKTSPKHVWDAAANNGLFSRLASDKNIPVTAFDIDPLAVEKNYLEVKRNREKHILPLIMDITNPSPGIGWQNTERMPFIQRGPADLTLCLALVHHLAISNNVPLAKIAAFFHLVSRNLVIEFVPKDDSQVRRLLATREDVFANYTQESFETEFSRYFQVVEATPVKDSSRVLYLMKAKDNVSEKNIT